ncbi:MAG TPA: hypothetical protein PKY35_08525 [Candidatus Hydrogenedentes bacterium]|nr:hypothetical protein [Candidatus Hydrogenedentota bacterium]HOL77060.1 hypothetical protein [Candidatus Hydrogenedentota bacterium]HPO85757.1 hypothetical protein [Candidatus Hydrogenedentota bacterium]
MKDEKWIRDNIASHLRGGEPCPEGLWSRVKGEIRAREAARQRRQRKIRLVYTSCLAAAACAVVGIGIFWLHLSTQRPVEDSVPVFLRFTDDDIASAEKTTEDLAFEPPQALFDRHGTQLAFNEDNLKSSADYPYRVVLTREATFKNDSVIEILVRREDGNAAKVIAARPGGPAAREIGKAVANGGVPVARSTSSAVVSAVGNSPTEDLVRLVSAVSGDALSNTLPSNTTAEPAVLEVSNQDVPVESVVPAEEPAEVVAVEETVPSVEDNGSNSPEENTSAPTPLIETSS